MVVLTLYYVDLTISEYYGNQTLLTMPEGWRPRLTSIGAGISTDTSVNLVITVGIDGAVVVQAQSGGEPPNGKTCTGQVVYFIS